MAAFDGCRSIKSFRNSAAAENATAKRAPTLNACRRATTHTPAAATAVIHKATNIARSTYQVYGATPVERGTACRTASASVPPDRGRPGSDDRKQGAERGGRDRRVADRVRGRQEETAALRRTRQPIEPHTELARVRGAGLEGARARQCESKSASGLRRHDGLERLVLVRRLLHGEDLAVEHEAQIRLRLAGRSSTAKPHAAHPGHAAIGALHVQESALGRPGERFTVYGLRRIHSGQDSPGKPAIHLEDDVRLCVERANDRGASGQRTEDRQRDRTNKHCGHRRPYLSCTQQTNSLPGSFTKRYGDWPTTRA